MQTSISKKSCLLLVFANFLKNHECQEFQFFTAIKTNTQGLQTQAAVTSA
jgi:hypothetical protein